MTLPKVAVSTTCNLPLCLHLLTEIVGLLLLMPSPKGLLQALDDFCRGLSIDAATHQRTISVEHGPVSYSIFSL
jgi:hypothetical protein